MGFFFLNNTHGHVFHAVKVRQPLLLHSPWASFLTAFLLLLRNKGNKYLTNTLLARYAIKIK